MTKQQLSEAESIAALCGEVMQNISRVIVGKASSLELLLTALLAEGHLLLEDVPGVGKTLLARALARSLGGTFKRVQFTPDLLPADVTGFNVYDRQSGQFKFQAGPVMANVLLADEINRAIPRTQSSLLESMEEGQVTVDGVTLTLPRPFLVIATQNPVELEGTFPLPEAQLDRFLLRLKMGYPSPAEEISILERFRQDDPLAELQAVITPAQVTALQLARRSIVVAAPVKEYIVSLVGATRGFPALRFGSSPRASLHLMRAAQALAALRGRRYVLPDDVKCLVEPVLAHRLSIEAKEAVRGVTTEKVLQEIVSSVAVPAPPEPEL
ncbi:MAG: MoxR family ATPase [Bacillota bacterium]